MQKFIKRIFFFGLIFFSVIIITFFISSKKVSTQAKFNIATPVKHIILGHSHPECAFNDSLLINFKNLASSGEAYFYTLVKLRVILEQNPQIETVFLEFTNNSISKRMEKWIWTAQYITWRYPIYVPFMRLEEQAFLAKQAPVNFLRAFGIATKKNLKKVMTSDYNFVNKIGSYQYLKRDKTDSLVQALTNKPIEIEKNVSYTHLDYLDKIISYCQKRGKKIYLVRSPQHPVFPDLQNERIFQKILQDKASSSHVQFLDFNSVPLKNTEYGDLGHLNFRGAHIFSKWLNDLIVKHQLLKSKNPQQIIENNMTPQIIASYRNK